MHFPKKSTINTYDIARHIIYHKKGTIYITLTSSLATQPLPWQMGPPRWNMMRVPPCRSFSCSHDIDTISNVIKSPPPSARSWPPAIDAQALGPIEQARMKAEDNKRIQERMALQAIIAQMPAGPDSTSTEESMASKKKPSDWKNGNKNTTTEANPSST